jgi:hypothetical protein
MGAAASIPPAGVAARPPATAVTAIPPAARARAWEAATSKELNPASKEIITWHHRQGATLLHPWRAPRGEGWRIKRRRAEGRAVVASRRTSGLDEEETKQPNEEKRKATVQARLLRKGTMVIIKK